MKGLENVKVVGAAAAGTVIFTVGAIARGCHQGLVGFIAGLAGAIHTGTVWETGVSQRRDGAGFTRVFVQMQGVFHGFWHILMKAMIVVSLNDEEVLGASFRGAVDVAIPLLEHWQGPQHLVLILAIDVESILQCLACALVAVVVIMIVIMIIFGTHGWGCKGNDHGEMKDFQCSRVSSILVLLGGLDCKEG